MNFKLNAAKQTFPPVHPISSLMSVKLAVTPRTLMEVINTSNAHDYSALSLDHKWDFLPLILSNNVLSFSVYQQINEASLKVHALLLAANNTWHGTMILPQEAFGIIAVTTLLTLSFEYLNCERNIHLSPRSLLNMHSHWCFTKLRL